MITRLLGILGIATLALGCSGGGPAGSCRLPAAGMLGETCVDFVTGYSASSAMTTCAAASTATYSATACATANRVGLCTLSSPEGTQSQTKSYYAPATVADAMADCASNRGMFTAN